MKTITKNIALFIITLGILSSPFSSHAATWVGPTATPPGNNVSAPVNIGPLYQIKNGDLGVFSLFANYIQSLGTIKALGTISANRYCFNNGTANGRDGNCITSWPAGGTGTTGIESIVAGTNVTVDDTDPLNPIVSSTATGGTSGVVVRKDGVPVVATATTLNFLGSNITTTPSGNSVSIAVAPATPATPTALQKDGIQVSAAPLALNLTGNNITATNTNGIVSIAVAPATPIAVRKDGVQVSAGPIALDFIGSNITAVNSSGVIKISVVPTTPATPTAIQKDGIQVSAAPLAINFRGNNISTLNTNGVVSVDVKNIGIQKNGVVVSANPPNLNFTGSNITTTTNVDGTVNLNIKTKISAVNEGAVIGTDFDTIDVGAGGLIATNAGNGVLMLGFDPTALGSVLPSPSPADKILRSNGTAWVQSPLVKHTVSSFQINRPFADNAIDVIFQAAKEIIPGTPALGLFVSKDGNTLVNGAKFIHAGVSGTSATPLFSFSSDDSFQTFVGTGGSKRGIAVRADGKVRVGGSIYSSQTFSPLFPGYFLGSNDLFQASAEFNSGAIKGFGLGIDGTTRVEGILGVNGGQALFGNMNHSGNTTQTGNTIQTGNTTQTGNYDLIGDINHTGNSIQNGDSYINGTLGVNGTIDQVGNHEITGNIVQLGNINTNGRWAVSDTIPNPLQVFGFSGGGVPTTPPVIPYTFLSKVSGAHSGSLGLTRTGSTVVNGDLQVYGPSTISGNLVVAGIIQSDTLTNNLGDRPVCATTDGKLKICASDLPTVNITGITSGFTLENSANSVYSFTTPRSYYVSGGANTNQAGTNKTASITYTITGATLSTPFSCQRNSSFGVIGWNSSSNFSVNANYTDTKSVQFNSYETQGVTVTCTNVDGQTVSDAISVKGHGSWATASSPTSYQSGPIQDITFPSVPLNVSIWGSGGSGGGRYYGYDNNVACGGGGGAGQYKNLSHPGGYVSNIYVGLYRNGVADGYVGLPGQSSTFGTITAGGGNGGTIGYGNSNSIYSSTPPSSHGTGGTAGTIGFVCLGGLGATSGAPFGFANGGVGAVRPPNTGSSTPGYIEVTW